VIYHTVLFSPVTDLLV